MALRAFDSILQERYEEERLLRFFDDRIDNPLAMERDAWFADFAANAHFHTVTEEEEGESPGVSIPLLGRPQRASLLLALYLWCYYDADCSQRLVKAPHRSTPLTEEHHLQQKAVPVTSMQRDEIEHAGRISHIEDRLTFLQDFRVFIQFDASRLLARDDDTGDQWLAIDFDRPGHMLLVDRQQHTRKSLSVTVENIASSVRPLVHATRLRQYYDLEFNRSLETSVEACRLFSFT
jgi:hypothetical protein